MSRSIITRFFASIRSTARMLMQEQERSITRSAVIAELRTLPEYLKRDIGLIDGNTVLENMPVRPDGHTEPGKRWNDLVVTPHAV